MTGRYLVTGRFHFARLTDGVEDRCRTALLHAILDGVTVEQISTSAIPIDSGVSVHVSAVIAGVDDDIVEAIANSLGRADDQDHHLPAPAVQTRPIHRR